MHTRAWLGLVPVLAATAGVVASGCGDDTSPGATTTPDSSIPDSSSGGGGDSTTKTDTGGGDAANEAAKDAGPCVDGAFNVETFDSGSPEWACFQTACMNELTACAAVCNCNTPIVNALLCSADASTTTAMMTCFSNQFPALTDEAGTALQTCIGGNLAAKANCIQYTMPMTEGGTDSGDGAVSEGGGDAGDAGDAGGGDSGDAGADATD
jgi:hypothetical protein